jgi:glycosyltransferase involved in cell wall biosynthesis
MRILWLSHIVPYPPKGGVLQRSYHLLRQTALRHEVTLYAFVQQRPVLQCFGDLDQGLAEAKRALEGFCKEVHFFPIPMESRTKGMLRLAVRSLLSRSSYTLNWLRSSSYSRALQQIDFSQIDLIHADTISLAPYAVRFSSTRKVLDHHNVESQMMRRRAENETNVLKRAYFSWEAQKILNEERRFCPVFDKNIMCSGLDEERLRDIVGPPVSTDVIPNGVDLNYFSPDSQREISGRLVFAGRMAAYTNRQAALFIVNDIWPLLVNAHPTITFDLVGGDPPDEARKLAACEPRFSVPGFVDDVRVAIAQAAIYVCPITDGGGTKLKVLDALAMGKALVADPIACEGIDVKEGESVRFARTAEEYAQVIGELIQDSDQRDRLGQAGRTLVEANYGYKNIGSRLHGVYEQLAANKPR